VTVVAAAGGYPGTYAKNFFMTLSPLPQGRISFCSANLDSYLFHAGTALDHNGHLVTAGGRVIAVTSTAADLKSAVARAYEAIKSVKFSLMHYRKDIAQRYEIFKGKLISELFGKNLLL
jgi:phosphoribosylamine--glycine ligase / phosphoribosylformylglycinamidine cyclo-ligase